MMQSKNPNKGNWKTGILNVIPFIRRGRCRAKIPIKGIERAKMVGDLDFKTDKMQSKNPNKGNWKLNVTHSLGSSPLRCRAKIPIKGIERVYGGFFVSVFDLRCRAKIPIKGIERINIGKLPLDDNNMMQSKNPNKGNWKHEEQTWWKLKES